eukprot:364901-Chlamydomonas_euryale.AAC.4
MCVDNAGSHRQSSSPLLWRVGQRSVGQPGCCYLNCATLGGHFRRQRRAHHFVWIAPTQLQRAMESPPELPSATRGMWEARCLSVIAGGTGCMRD